MVPQPNKSPCSVKAIQPKANSSKGPQPRGSHKYHKIYCLRDAVAVVLCHHSPRQISLTFRQHPLYSVGDPYICATALYGQCYHFHTQHSLHPPFASGRHLLMPEPSHPSHVIGSFVTGTAITSACQEARPDSVVPPLLRQAVECGRNRDNGDSKWRQGATRRQ